MSTRLLLLMPILLSWGQIAMAIELKINIQGIEGKLKTNVEQYLSLTQMTNHPKLTVARLKQLFKKSLQEIQQGLRPLGYYNSEIQSELTHTKTQWTANYKIILGNPIKISNIDIQLLGAGQADADLQTMPEFPLKVGDTLRHSQYNKGKQALLKWVYDKGYLDSQFTVKQLKVYPDHNQADIILHLNTGSKYFIGNINFDQHLFSQAFLSRYIPKPLPFVYSNHTLLTLYQNLYQSQYFDIVDIQPQQAQAKDNMMPVEVYLKPKVPHRIATGIGFGTDTGFRTNLQWNWRYLNAQGHYLQTNLALSQIKAGFSTEYVIPLEKPLTEQLKFSFGYQNEFGTENASSAWKLGGSKTKVLDWQYRNSHWLQTLSLHYLYETFEAGELTEETSSFLMIGSRYQYRWSNDKIYPSKGLSFDFFTQAGLEPLLSSTSFVQTRLISQWIFPLVKKHRMRFKTDLATTWVDNFDLLPKSLRFFAGGDNSIRGYGYEELGPVDEQNDVIGGKHLFITTVEYDYRLLPDWIVGLFYDGGNASSSLSDWQWFSGVGVGIAWLSPIGKVRLDLAFPLEPIDDTHWRIHFNIGVSL